MWDAIGTSAVDVMVAVNAVNAADTPDTVGSAVGHRKDGMGILVDRIRGIAKKDFTKNIRT